MNVPVDSDSEEYEAVNDEEGEGAKGEGGGKEEVTDMPLD